MHSLDSLDHALTRTYLAERQTRINALIAAGLRQPVTDGEEVKKPRSYVYELFCMLAAIQTEIADVSKVLLRPLMGELFTGLFSHFVQCIRAIQSSPLTMHEFQQLDAELAVLEDVLASGMSEEAGSLALASHSALSSLVVEGAKAVRFHTAPILKQFASFQYT